MSTFGGKIQEIPNISVDRFDNENLKSEAYFLSHCHYDHMVGLRDHVFQNMLVQENKFLYVSDISCAILKKMFPYIENNLRVLDMYEPTAIVLKKTSITVLPVPAGHCPGSVMFLFESDNYVLYTGDYRINKNDIRRIKAFYDSRNNVKSVAKIYLDTTFFLKRYLKFPKRAESLNELCKIIEGWMKKGKNYMVKLCTSANYGYEYIFIEIYNKFRIPVHVNDEIYKLYSLIPEMDKSITTDSSLTQIHCNCGSTYQSICKLPFNTEIRYIKISAFRWQQDELQNGLSNSESNTYYVCYSTHASYEEGVELINFLKPKDIEACVLHNDAYTNLEIKKLIQDALTGCDEEPVQHQDRPKLFETEANSSNEPLCNLKGDSSSFSDEFGILDSPPRVCKERDILTIKKFEKLETLTTPDRIERNSDEDFPDEFGILDSPPRQSGMKRKEIATLSKIELLEKLELFTPPEYKENKSNDVSSRGFRILNSDAGECIEKNIATTSKIEMENLEEFIPTKTRTSDTSSEEVVIIDLTESKIEKLEKFTTHSIDRTPDEVFFDEFGILNSPPRQSVGNKIAAVVEMDRLDKLSVTKSNENETDIEVLNSTPEMDCTKEKCVAGNSELGVRAIKHKSKKFKTEDKSLY